MRKLSSSISDESYYSGRVKLLSKFVPKPEVPSLASYKEVFQKIHSLMELVERFYYTIAESEDFIELVFKTPDLLNKLFQSDGGPFRIIGFLTRYPAFHIYVFQNSELAQQFASSEDYWASSFILLIFSKPEIFKGLLDSDEMMRALAKGVKTISHDDSRLCGYLKEKYHPDERYIDSVLNLKAPPLELEQREEEREEAVFNLLRSLRSAECTESCSYN